MKTKKVKGFTLIELIVVIAIIGVLAAILVPTLMTWTMRSKIGSNNATAKTIYTAYQAELTDLETRGATAPTAILTSTAASTDQMAQAISDSVSGFNAKMKWAVSSTSYFATAAVFSGNGTDLTGGYPNPVGAKVNVSYAGDSSQLANAANKSGNVSGWNTK